MRVLAVARPDHGRVSGGDLVQIRETLGAVEHHGVHWDICGSISDTRLSEYDLVHFFHLPAVKQVDVELLLGLGIPIVLSPVFWDTTAMAFDGAVVNSPAWKALASIMGLRAGRILYTHWQHLKRKRNKSWLDQREILKQVQIVLPNSHAELRHLGHFFNIDAQQLLSRSRITPNGISPTLFEDLDSASQRFRDRTSLGGFVLEVGRIERAKGQIDLIKAIPDPRIKIVFIGSDSPYEPEYAVRCREAASARGNTFFIGQMPQTELVGAYATAEAHVLPSWRETPGLVSLEAAAAGCRVVSTELGSAREYLGNLAWYCHPARKNTITQAVSDALSSPRTTVLRERVLRNYTWDRAGELTYLAYKRALAT